MQILKLMLACSLLMVKLSYANRIEAVQINKYEINKFSQVLEYTDKLGLNQPPTSLCVIYDLDNTILSAEPKIGGDSWMSWNRSLVANDPNRIEQWGLSTDIHGFEGALRFFIKNKPTEADTREIVNTIKDQYGHPSIVMTARSYERYYAATKNQLEANQFDFMSNPIGNPATANDTLTLEPNTRKTAYKAYFNGVYYSADDNKGNEILKLIKQQRQITGNNQLCRTTIFIDNSNTNVENVYQAFLASTEQLNLVALRYAAYDNYLTPTDETKSSWNINNSDTPGKLFYNWVLMLNK